MANKNFTVKNGLEVGGQEVITSAGVLTNSAFPTALAPTFTDLTLTGSLSGTLASSVTGTTQSAGDNSTKIATTAYIATAVANLVDSSPTTLDTLNELAAALGDDPNFATTVTTSIATKLPLAGGTMTGNVSFGDSVKATFGAGDDLQIYHTGSNSVITDTGTGNLIVRANDLRMTSYALEHNFLQANESGAVTIYHNNAVKLATTNTGIDVTGTVTADGLEIGDNQWIYAGNGADLKIGHDGIAANVIRSQGHPLYIDSNGINFRGYSPYTKHMDIASNGDISFYEDTGTTPKFFWDASAESLGIGTSLPSVKLDVYGTDPRIQSSNSTAAVKNILLAGGTSGYVGMTTNHPLVFITNDTERMRIDSAGNVGIGTSSPATSLHVVGGVQVGSASDYIRFVQTNTSTFGVLGGTAGDYIYFMDTANKRIGIGTSSPGNKLQINASSAIADELILKLDGSGAGFNGNNDANIKHGLVYELCSYSASTGVVQRQAAKIEVQKVGSWNEAAGGAGTKADLVFSTNDGTIATPVMAERMRIDSSGKVGIGTDAPGSKLEVYNSTTSGNTQLHIHNDKAGDAAVLRLEGKRTSLNDTGQVLFVNNGNVVAKIDARSAADDGALRFFTSATGTGSTIAEAMSIATDKAVAIGGPVTITSDSEYQFKINASSAAGASMAAITAGSYAYTVHQNSSKQWRNGAYGGSSYSIVNATDGVYPLILSSSGAATFVSTVQATELICTSNGITFSGADGKTIIKTGRRQGTGTYTLFTNGSGSTQSAGTVEIWGIYGTPSDGSYANYLISGNRSIQTVIAHTETNSVPVVSLAWNGADLQVSNSNSSLYYAVRVTLAEIGNTWAPTWGNFPGMS